MDPHFIDGNTRTGTSCCESIITDYMNCRLEAQDPMEEEKVIVSHRNENPHWKQYIWKDFELPNISNAPTFVQTGRGVTLASQFQRICDGTFNWPRFHETYYWNAENTGAQYIYPATGCVSHGTNEVLYPLFEGDYDAWGHTYSNGLAYDYGLN